jgi:hypothetical protein
MEMYEEDVKEDVKEDRYSVCLFSKSKITSSLSSGLNNLSIGSQ